MSESEFHSLNVWFQDKLEQIPAHSGWDIAGIERAISYLLDLHKEVNEFDLDFSKYASEKIASNIAILKDRIELIKSKNLPEFKFAVKEGLDETYLPTRGDSVSTGWDVRATEKIILKPFDSVKIPLGLRTLSPAGWWLELRPRSSTFGKKNLSALYGVIDESYEGELLFACQWIPPVPPMTLADAVMGTSPHLRQDLVIEKGERIGQLIPVKRQEMKVVGVSNEELDAAFKARGLERGVGGFGSTGK